MIAGCKSPNEVQFTYDPVTNIDALWQIIDEKYCYVEEKGCDWNAVHEEYRLKAAKLHMDSTMDKVKLFDLMASMLDSLKDGHVNLYTPFDVSRNRAWYTGYPTNYSSQLQGIYLQNYRTAEGLRYTILKETNPTSTKVKDIGYVYYSSFESGCSNSALSWVLYTMKDCKGLIIDVRQNGGGDMTNAFQLASPFFKTDKVVGYWQHKTGKGHYDLSSMEPQKVIANTKLQWQRPVVVITNRYCYSAANFFVSAMKAGADNCIILGGKTGGGGGMPLSYELPCGWTIRFSSVKMLDLDKQSIEDGIDPNMEIEQVSSTQDDLIEAAAAVILNSYIKK